MAQPATNPKIEELRSKVKADPKSRLFFPLAEELRKAGQTAEAEHVLRTGLMVYPTYLAAWVSLGRVLHELRKDADAVEALTKALQLDGGNVVAARLLADTYVDLGDKVEAIKKYKLVQALLPGDDELRETVHRLELDLSPPSVSSFEGPETIEERQLAPPPTPMEESPFDKTVPPFGEAERELGEELRVEQSTGDLEPMSAAHEESPFEEPAGEYGADALTLEEPLGMHISAAPLAAEVAAPIDEDFPVADSVPVFDTPEERPAASASDDVTNTLTMADLYARQGLVDDARHIYESILARHPENAEVRAKLDAFAPKVNPKVARLEQWLARVGRKEVGRV